MMDFKNNTFEGLPENGVLDKGASKVSCNCLA